MKYALLLAILLPPAIAGCAGRRGAEDAAAEKAAEVKVCAAAAAEETISETVYGLGRCEALPGKIAAVTAGVEGQVVQILVAPGATVQAGQPVVLLNPMLAEAAVGEKKAARDAQVAALRLLESRPRAEEQRSAQLAIEQARVARAAAQTLVDHLRPLRQRNEVSDAKMNEAESALKQAQLQLQTAQSQYDVLMLRPRPQAIDEAKARIAEAEAALASARVHLDLYTIRAPIGGVLDSLACQIGQTLAVGGPVGQIVETRTCQIVIWLALPDARRVRPGQTAELQPTQSGPPAHKARGNDTGNVATVGTVADPQTGNVPVRVLVDNAAGELTLGQSLGVKITVGQRTVLAVPAAAIFDLGEGPVLNVIRNGKTVVLHPKLGISDRELVEVADSDLRPGELVVTDGGYNLPEGAKVLVVSPEAIR